MESEETVIVGGSAAGLASAACLRQRGRPFRVLEAADRVGATWRGHYDRLHLHTSRGLSGLPGMPMPRSFPKYPSRDQMVAYLEDYARHFDVAPRFGERVTRIRPDDGGWLVESRSGPVRARNVVVATGYTRVPHVPDWPDRDGYGGTVLHSSAYRSGASFRGQRVLVVGFGNSGGEIAIDLHEHGAKPDLAVRGAVNVVPRDVLGVPILALGIAFSPLPARLADLLSAPLLWATVGDLRTLGFHKLPYGPAEQVTVHGRIPLIDIGTIGLVRAGAVRIRPAPERFTAGGMAFAGGSEGAYDAVVLATGYRARLGEIVEAAGVLDADGTPTSSGREVAPGLWFCGFYVAPTGMLREIAREADRIATGIAAGIAAGSPGPA